jgi:hypothetical protein
MIIILNTVSFHDFSAEVTPIGVKKIKNVAGELCGFTMKVVCASQRPSTAFLVFQIPAGVAAF